MTELRRNISTGEWVVLASERAKRPEEFSRGKEEHATVPERLDTCPFCPGNESMTPGALAQAGDGAAWRVRAVPNRFAVFSPIGSLEPRGDDYRRSMDGVGRHEVIIQTPLHNAPEARFPDGQMREVVLMYLERYRAMAADERIEVIIPFKNHGLRAGTSLSHPHAQMAGVPLVPTHMLYRIEEPLHYYREKRSCVFCRMLAEELADGKRIIDENDSFVSFVPFASSTPFETWIVPRAHRPSFGSIGDAEAGDLAAILGSLLRRVYEGLNNPDYNYVIRSAPRGQRNAEFLHWYLKFVPRLTWVAGFELGTGMFINVVSPEESARFLRGVRTGA